MANLTERAIDVTGDATIIDANVMHPKGHEGAEIAGAVVGLGTDLADNAGNAAAGSMVGEFAGSTADRVVEGLPANVCVAVSPTMVYLLGDHALGRRLTPIANIDRTHLKVTVHQETTVHGVDLQDLATGHVYQLEFPRLDLRDTQSILDLLTQETNGSASNS